MDNLIKKLKSQIDEQCRDGNWNYDSYMLGMANGMIYSLSLLEGNAPIYLEAPDKWLCDSKHEPRENETYDVRYG